jgi:hypothetical protein
VERVKWQIRSSEERAGRARAAHQRTGSFRRGREKRGGRKKGTPNLITANDRKAIMKAAYHNRDDGTARIEVSDISPGQARVTRDC